MATSLGLAPVTKVLLLDDFFSDPSGPVSSSLWSFPTGAAEFIPSTLGANYPGTELEPYLPSVVNGALDLTLRTYNPTSNPPGTSFLGSEVMSNQTFNDNAGGIAFTAVAKLATTIPGLDGGIFSFGLNNPTSHNEINSELLTDIAARQNNEEQTNIYLNEPTNSVGHPSLVLDPSLTAYQTYTIEWFPDAVLWFINGQLVQETTSNVPQGPLSFDLNFWAYDAGGGSLQPTTNSANDPTYHFYVEMASVASIGSNTAFPAENVDEWILANGQWSTSIGPGIHPAGYQTAAVGNFTGNGTSDILWTDPLTGDVDEWQLANGQWTASVDLGAHPGTGWQIAGTGDFTGDGTDDILWTNSSKGQVQTDIWELSNGQWANSVSPGTHPAGYDVVGIGNFTGNVTSGILWYDPMTGDVDEWTIANGQWSGSIDLGSHPGTGWQVAGTGDFTGDGTDDILWTNSSNGQVQTDIWELSNGQWAKSVSPGLHPSGYQVVGIGDFAGNGTSGILWYDTTTGDVDEWKIANGQWSGSIDLGAHPGNGPQIMGIGDFSGGGTSAVLWNTKA